MSSLKELLELHKKVYKNKSDITHITFRSTLSRLAKLYPELKEGDITFLNNSDEVLNKLQETYKLNTVSSTISNIIKLIRIKKGKEELEGRYLELLSDLMERRDKTSNKQELTEEREDKFVSFNELQQKLNETYDEYIDSNKSFSDFRRYLLINLFVRNIPVRLGNYLNMKVIKKTKKNNESFNNKNNNYLIIKGDDYYFIFNKYKTSKTYNQKIVQIKNDKMKSLIKKWFSNYNKNPEYFLVNNDRTETNQKNLTSDLLNITKKLFNKSFSVDMIRSSYITYLYDTDPTLEIKEKVSHVMGNSVTTAEKHYNKNFTQDVKRDDLGLPIEDEK